LVFIFLFVIELFLDEWYWADWYEVVYWWVIKLLMVVEQIPSLRRGWAFKAARNGLKLEII
jgi:hypothetical protein